MTPLDGGPFAAALAADRGHCNARFAEARRRYPRLDGGRFLDLLSVLVSPAVEAAHAHDPERTSEVSRALYDLALDLLGREVLGPAARRPAVADGWARLLPRLGRPLAAAPGRLAAALTNGLYRLAGTPGARPEAWVEAWLRLAPLGLETEDLLRAGQVAAWRAGLAHYREAALELVRVLPAQAVAAALGLPAGTPAGPGVLDRLEADPWLAPADAVGVVPTRPLAVAARVGGFRGFGGPFLRPPTVRPAGPHFLASDGQDSWLLAADDAGATWHRAADGRGQVNAAAFSLDRDGTVRAGRETARFPELAQATSWAANAHTLAVTTALSHHVVLVARCGMP